MPTKTRLGVKGSQPERIAIYEDKQGHNVFEWPLIDAAATEAGLEVEDVRKYVVFIAGRVHCPSAPELVASYRSYMARTADMILVDGRWHMVTPEDRLRSWPSTDVYFPDGVDVSALTDDELIAHARLTVGGEVTIYRQPPIEMYHVKGQRGETWDYAPTEDEAQAKARDLRAKYPHLTFAVFARYFGGRVEAV